MISVKSLCRIFILSFIALLLSKPVFCSSTKPLQSNYEIFDSLAKEFSKDAFTQTISGKYDKINTIFPKFPSAFLVESSFANYISDKKIELLNDTNIIITHNFYINQFEMKYEELSSSNDSIVRIFNLITTVSAHSPKYPNFSKFNYMYADTVSREDIPFLESNSLPFTKPPVPEKKKTLFEKVIEPAIIVSAAIITVLILFTVRSQ